MYQLCSLFSSRSCAPTVCSDSAGTSRRQTEAGQQQLEEWETVTETGCCETGCCARCLESEMLNAHMTG
eukprot:846193-Amphidinium_carterae.3